MNSIVLLPLYDPIEVYDIFHHARLQIRTGHGFVHFIEDYINVWNVVDWISIAFSFALVIMFIEHCMLVKHCRKLLADVGALEKPDQDSLNALFDFQKTVSMQFHHLKYVAAIYPMVCILRLFKAFSDCFIRRSCCESAISYIAYVPQG